MDDIEVDRPAATTARPSAHHAAEPPRGGESPEPSGAAEPAPVVGSSQPLAIGIADGPPVLGSGSADLGAPAGKRRRGDRVFLGLTAGAAGAVVAIVVAVAVFLVAKSYPAIRDDKANFLTSFDWAVSSPGNLRFGIPTLLWTTVLVSLLALLIAVPLAIGIALFITHFAPARLAKPVAYAIDLLAAIPSIIYGIWGIRVLAPHLTGTQNVLANLHAIPLFKIGFPTGTVFDAGIVLAIMILPIITAISRDVYARTPRANIEAALALGATRWEVIRMAVLPFGRAGVVSGAMLGLGRALGETVAIYLILSKSSTFGTSLFAGGETFASKIANSQAEFGNNPGPYIAAGLVLFVLTFVVNAAARAIVNRRKDFV